MKTIFQNLKEKADTLSVIDLQNEVYSLVDQIIETDNSLLSVSKQFKGYGTWQAIGFANEFYFGKELSDLITKGINGSITHDEDREFAIEDFEEKIFNSIYESI